MQDRKIQAAITLVAEVLKISANELGPDSSMMNTPLWDSVEHLDICLAFEKRFQISLDMDAISTSTSIRGLATNIPDISSI